MMNLNVDDRRYVLTNQLKYHRPPRRTSGRRRWADQFADDSIRWDGRAHHDRNITLDFDT